MTDHKWYLRCNTLAFLLSLATCFGLLLIAAFQVCLLESVLTMFWQVKLTTNFILALIKRTSILCFAIENWSWDTYAFAKRFFDDTLDAYLCICHNSNSEQMVTGHLPTNQLIDSHYPIKNGWLFSFSEGIYTLIKQSYTREQSQNVTGSAKTERNMNFSV